MADRPRRDSRRPDLTQQRESAAELAIAALSFIASEPERLGRFLALTGIGPETLREAARTPDFLVGVLDHLAQDESLLLAFAEQNDIDPEAVTRARDMLKSPGTHEPWP